MKYHINLPIYHIRACRSRKGAWIEIPQSPTLLLSTASRSRKGAWIEIRKLWKRSRSGASRSRKGAWIEIHEVALEHITLLVAPVRERGLKSWQCC